MQIDNERYEKQMQSWSKGVVKESRDLFSEFGEPFNICKTVKATNSKFGIHIEHKNHKRTKCKVKSKRVLKESRDLHLEFFDPISREHLS